MPKLTAIQLCSEPDVDANLALIEQQLAALTIAEQHLVVLPECCLFFGGKDQQQLELARNVDAINLTKRLANLAQTYQVFLVAGTIPLLANCGDKFCNASCVFSPNGELMARYDKIHLFDVHVQDNEGCYLESKFTQAGEQLVTTDLGFGTLGLSVCYDIRFPELYRQLTQRGATIITVPAAFTRPTGKAHWQALLQARAIENQVYIIAAGQEGVHQNGRETWGHSMIISPWGEILAQIPNGTGSISAEYQTEELANIRRRMPVFDHNKFKTELTPYE